MSESTHNELLPMNYLKVFFRRKEIIIMAVFIGLVGGICAGMLMPKKYVSSTILLVEEGKTDNPLFSQLAVSTTVKQRLSTISESMLGWNSLVKLVKRLNMDKEITSPKELENLVLGIRKNIAIDMRGANIINLKYFGKDPNKTQAVVKNITEIFIERNLEIQNQETVDAIRFIEEQLKVYKGKIKSAEIAQARDSLKALLVDSTDQHPRVKQLREHIAVKEAELAKENLEYTEDMPLAEGTTNPIIDEIRKALDNLEGSGTITTNPQQAVGQNDIYKVMLIDKLDTVLARDAGVNNTIYNTLLQRLETAKITQRLQFSKEGTRYTILDPPRIPLDPIKPNKLLVALAGVIAGLGAGVALVFGMEFMDRSFIDVEEAKHFLGSPLLGAISKITTDATIRKEKERLRWLYSLTGFAGVILIILTMAIANFIN